LFRKEEIGQLRTAFSSLEALQRQFSSDVAAISSRQATLEARQKVAEARQKAISVTFNPDSPLEGIIVHLTPNAGVTYKTEAWLLSLRRVC
jgi:hypothetical protein